MSNGDIMKMKTFVRVISGVDTKGNDVSDRCFELLRSYQTNRKGGYIVVNNDGGVNRIRLTSNRDYEILAVDDNPTGEDVSNNSIAFNTKKATVAKVETDEEAMNRIKERFDILDQMAASTISGAVRALIVSGPPGVGKSFGVEQQMEKASMFDRLADRKVRYEVVKGAMTAIGLYCTLYRFSDPKNVLVFDDCDSVLMDDLSLNILKAALDSGKKRRICWNSDSAMLRREGVPDQFEFKGAVIFITNLKFGNIKSKKLQDHLEALQSRCHFLDLTIDTERDKMLRIRQVDRDTQDSGGLFKDYDFQNNEGSMVLDFMQINLSQLREISLRMALKLADLVKISPEKWQALARNTCMKNSF